MSDDDYSNNDVSMRREGHTVVGGWVGAGVNRWS